MDKCYGRLILLSGDGEFGEGMSEPFFCICDKCGNTDFYSVENSNKPCNGTLDGESILNLRFNENDNTIVDIDGDVILDGKELEGDATIIKEVFDIYHIFGVTAITEFIIEEHLDKLGVSTKDDYYINSSFREFIYG